MIPFSLIAQRSQVQDLPRSSSTRKSVIASLRDTSASLTMFQAGAAIPNGCRYHGVKILPLLITRVFRLTFEIFQRSNLYSIASTTVRDCRGCLGRYKARNFITQPRNDSGASGSRGPKTMGALEQSWSSAVRRETGAAGLLTIAVLLPLLGIMLTLGMELTNYFSALHLTQEIADKAVLDAEKLLPNTQAAESVIRARFQNASAEIPNLSTLSVTSVTYQSGILTTEVEGSLNVFGIGLASLFSPTDQSGNIPFKISTSARSQSVDMLLVIDGFQTPLIALEPRGQEPGGAVCPGLRMAPAFNIINSLISKISALPLSRAQVILAPYNGQAVYAVFPETELPHGSPECSGLIRQNTQYSQLLENYLSTPPEANRPYDPSFAGAASVTTFLSGGEALLKLKDPIRRTIFYVPAFGVIPENYSADVLITSVLTAFDSVRRLAIDMKEKTEVVVLVPMVVGEGPSLTQILRGGDSSFGLSVKIIEAPADLGAQSDLSSLLASSIHSGVLSR